MRPMDEWQGTLMTIISIISIQIYPRHHISQSMLQSHKPFIKHLSFVSDRRRAVHSHSAWVWNKHARQQHHVMVIKSAFVGVEYIYQLLRWLWCRWMSTRATMSCFQSFFQLLDSFIMSLEYNFYLTHVIHQFSPFLEGNAKLRRVCWRGILRVRHYVSWGLVGHALRPWCGRWGQHHWRLGDITIVESTRTRSVWYMTIISTRGHSTICVGYFSARWLHVAVFSGGVSHATDEGCTDLWRSLTMYTWCIAMSCYLASRVLIKWTSRPF